jgi:predicted AAA+ superfamily ATPase
MSLTEENYKPRLVDNQVEKLLKIFGAVSIEGSKWCGKTWTALNHAESVIYIADPSGNFGNREKALIDPSLVLAGEPPLVIDEWQEVPGIWDAVRFSVDRDQGTGRFILTGSSTPPKDSYIHSGVGRIARLRMRPMSLIESGDSNGSVSLKSLFRGEHISPHSSNLTLEHIAGLIVRGGWPAGIKYSGTDAAVIPKQYIDQTVDSEALKAAKRGFDKNKLKATLRSLARNNATMVSNATIEKDVIANEERDTVSRNTLSEYLSILKSMYVIDEIPGWDPEIRSRKRLRTSPKRIMVDPSLAVATLGGTQEKLMNDMLTLGFMFEGLCLRDLLIYAGADDMSVFHYHDDTGLEADAILESADGSWGAFEIKLGNYQIDGAADNLLTLKDKMIKQEAPPPVCLVVITGQEGLAYQRKDGVYVVPIDCLTI